MVVIVSCVAEGVTLTVVTLLWSVALQLGMLLNGVEKVIVQVVPNMAIVQTPAQVFAEI